MGQNQLNLIIRLKKINYLDTYSLRARLLPAFLVLLPFVVLAVSIFQLNWEKLQIILAVLATFGGTYLLAHLGRDMGKRKELKLYGKWGGKPTTILMRYREKRLSELTRQRYFEKLRLKLSIKMPTETD